MQLLQTILQTSIKHNEKEKRRTEKEVEMKEKKIKREIKKKEAKEKIDSKKTLNKSTKDNVSDTEIKVTKRKRTCVATTYETAEEDKSPKNPKTEVVQIGKGDYVIVIYKNKRYPGLVTDMDKEEYEISTMEQKQGMKHRWRWPNVPDKIWYKYNNIVKKIPEPSAGGSDSYFYVNIL